MQNLSSQVQTAPINNDNDINQDSSIDENGQQILCSRIILLVYNDELLWLDLLRANFDNSNQYKLGFRYGVLIGIFLTTVGLWLRCLINYNFIWALIGQTILAVAQPFLYNAPPKISANWFGKKERLYSTSVAANANTLGVAIGYFIPALFVKDEDEFNDEDAKNHTWQLMICLAAISTIILVPVAFTLKDKPPTPPSLSQQDTDEQKVKQSLKKDLILLLKNKGYMLTCFANGGVIGYTYVFSTLLSQIITIYGFTASQSSWIGTIHLLAGIVGGILISFFLTRKPRYKFFSILITVMTFGTAYFATVNFSYEYLMVASAINGFFSMGVFSVAYELGVEMSFPIGEATSGGLTNSVANVIGFVLVIAMTPILERGQSQDVLTTILILLGILLISSLLFAFTKFDLRRINYEQEKVNNSGIRLRLGKFKDVQDVNDGSSLQSDRPIIDQDD
ncbi:major facilitator superfamily protein [Stylonychia lemnae]|uniref:Major facilitator superfamily protein n=1 Tax=Stylonychia lemnae TaxID=5949 RepID=A0A078AUL0_STYLE|nr:major facilitator superfamily protein [Stylonychia lemnae]|eukprot:CDW85706.1 major facilitator superfamily protein [Stylonychia lemnae]